MPTLRSTGGNRDNSPDPASHAPTSYDVPLSTIVTDGDSGDDDMDFEPLTTESEHLDTGDEDDATATTGDGEEESDEDSNAEFIAAVNEMAEDDVQLNVETGEISIQLSQAGPLDENGDGGTGAVHPLLRFVTQANLRRLLEQYGGLPSAGNSRGENEDSERNHRRRTRAAQGSESKAAPGPSPVGQELMANGVFGRNEGWQDVAKHRRKNAARRIMMRELGLNGYGARSENETLSQYMIPGTPVDKIIHYDAKCYSGQFSDDGDFFFCCAQDFRVRMYDTSNPYDWKYYKTVDFPYGRWTITDATLSPDNKFLAYSSMRPQICLSSTDPNDSSSPWMLDLADDGGSSTGSRRRHGYGNSHFSVFSIRFSGDGREIVAGTGDKSVIVFDLDTSKTKLCIPAHGDDVNAVCYGDKASPHILYSGSDDTLIKVWDRRSMQDNRPAGVFLGHTEGLTYVDSRGDGRYVLSNAKDQTMKLWDLRKMMSTERAAGFHWKHFTSRFDYRFTPFDAADARPHPQDCSLVTFRGHRVLRTLIRCHFAPPGSAGARYVYSGSEDGRVHVYNLDATPAARIDVRRATYASRPARGRDAFADEYEFGDRSLWHTCVRDASWHPSAPVLAATSWNGWGGAGGTCTVHSWNDGADEDEADAPMGHRVDPRLVPDPWFYAADAGAQGPTTRAAARARLARLRSRGVARAAAGDDDDEAMW